MIYNFKEYNTVFDTPMKIEQELVISRKIMDLLNKNKYDDLEEFIQKNDNYQNFLKKNNMTTVIKHFGNTLTEEDYVKILENLRKLTKAKKEFNEENIKTTNLSDKQFVSFKEKDKTYFLDNSDDKKSIQEQMQDLQPTQQDFQTADQNENTKNMFKELERKKEGLDIYYLNEINYDSLNNEEKVLFQVAKDYQEELGKSIRLDFKKGIIVDDLDNIMKIEEQNGEFTVIKGEDGIEKKETVKTFQKKITPSSNTIYSN